MRLPDFRKAALLYRSDNPESIYGMLLIIRSFFYGRHDPGDRPSQSKRAVNGRVPISKTIHHSNARWMIGRMARRIRLAIPRPWNSAQKSSHSNP